MKKYTFAYWETHDEKEFRSTEVLLGKKTWERGRKEARLGKGCPRTVTLTWHCSVSAAQEALEQQLSLRRCHVRQKLLGFIPLPYPVSDSPS